MNKYYQLATSSAENYIKFIVHSQYPFMINRAIGNKLVNSDVGESVLADAVYAAYQSNPAVFENTMDFTVQTSKHLNPEVNEAIEMLKANANKPQLLYSQSGGSGSGAGSGNGGSGAGTGGGNGAGGWSSTNTDSAISLGGSILGFFGALFGGGGTPQPGGDTPTPPTPKPDDNPETNYTPYVFGGIAILIVIIVIVLLYLKSKGK